MDKEKKIVLTGGGTAGHVTPHLAIIPHLRKDGWEIHYIGTEDGIEHRLIEDVNKDAGETVVTYHSVPSGKLRRYFDVKNFTDPFRVMKGVGKAGSLVGKLRPSVVFSKGGFVSVPVVYGAFMHGVPVVLHESDITPGLANKITAPFAKAVCTTFPEAAEAVGAKGVTTGSPIRESLFKGSRPKGLAFAGFDGRKPVLLMMGGSSGAQSVNKALRDALPALAPKYDILHICGKGNTDSALSKTVGYRQFEYVDKQLPDVFAATDIMLSRSGSNALSEILALRVPALLVPYPKGASRGDQILNAQSFMRRGFSQILYQEDLSAETLARSIDTLYADRARLRSAMEREPASNGIEGVLAQIYKYAK
ncbi:MAG: undecaprenyldiphospho-muramoylpentapeptide beta-N-acetylglucosaminyltransferase [Oscillospiraceae bacterium]|jgi:UDP-N-acetylglucosamine--N-acetylmuramyl-(pentapeptide) pyrophosphoryl-undecaprenol N-acetylglucosamine transferase|nr:undecaprenyldiphospho-muramoylpentapeptide beta-N-acetylglucosaminyltransferase [Oscillospiraceae bacterium]